LCWQEKSKSCTGCFIPSTFQLQLHIKHHSIFWITGPLKGRSNLKDKRQYVGTYFDINEMLKEFHLAEEIRASFDHVYNLTRSQLQPRNKSWDKNIPSPCPFLSTLPSSTFHFYFLYHDSASSYIFANFAVEALTLLF
jgi:hypothetical protein